MNHPISLHDRLEQKPALSEVDCQDLLQAEKDVNANGERYATISRGLLERILNGVDAYGLEPDVVPPQASNLLGNWLGKIEGPAGDLVDEHRLLPLEDAEYEFDALYPELQDLPLVIKNYFRILDKLADGYNALQSRMNILEEEIKPILDKTTQDLSETKSELGALKLVSETTLDRADESLAEISDKLEPLTAKIANIACVAEE